jgi:exodeoxyribonuclease VII small subunit
MTALPTGPTTCYNGRDMKKPPPGDEPTFEQAIARLEEIVAELDRGDLALEEALKLFQEGTALRGACERKLAEAEATVEQLLERGTPVTEANDEAALASHAPASDSLFDDDDN